MITFSKSSTLKSVYVFQHGEPIGTIYKIGLSPAARFDVRRRDHCKLLLSDQDLIAITTQVQLANEM